MTDFLSAIRQFREEAADTFDRHAYADSLNARLEAYAATSEITLPEADYLRAAQLLHESWTDYHLLNPSFSFYRGDSTGTLPLTHIDT